MTFDEGIQYCERVIDHCESAAEGYDPCDLYERHSQIKELECADAHRHFLEWIKELKSIKEN